MAVLNVTYAGRSADVTWDVDDDLSDAEIRRVAAEAVRERPALFAGHVVDRIRSPDGMLRLYLRPKVPFG